MFGYDHAIVESYPAIRAGVIHAAGLVNGPSPPALVDAYEGEQRAALKRLEEAPIAELPSIAAWRRAFSQFGTKPTQYRSAPEALLRRLSKHGDIPSINTLVDIGNLVSIRYGLPVAVFDQADVTGSTIVRFSLGNEQFTNLGADEHNHPDAGEVIFVDHADVVSARRWCWRQSAQSATGATTTEALIVTEALHEGADESVGAARADLASLLEAHLPAHEATSHALSASNPRMTRA